LDQEIIATLVQFLQPIGSGAPGADCAVLDQSAEIMSDAPMFGAH
jgi:hypothetical protein